MSESSGQKRTIKDFQIVKKDKDGESRVIFSTADILAIAASLVAIIIAIGMVFRMIDGKVGASILIPVCGGAAIAKVVGARRGKSRK